MQYVICVGKSDTIDILKSLRVLVESIVLSR